MADKAVVTQTTLDAIGQAIIDKGGATEAMTPAQMPAAIQSIPSVASDDAPPGGWIDDGNTHSWFSYPNTWTGIKQVLDIAHSSIPAYSAKIYWGDGSSDTITNSRIKIVHTYETGGDYRIDIISDDMTILHHSGNDYSIFGTWSTSRAPCLYAEIGDSVTGIVYGLSRLMLNAVNFRHLQVSLGAYALGLSVPRYILNFENCTIDGRYCLSASCFDLTINCENIAASGSRYYVTALNMTLGSRVNTIGADAFRDSQIIHFDASQSIVETIGQYGLYSAVVNYNTMYDSWIKLPSTILSIGAYALSQCYSDLFVYATNPPSIESNTLSNAIRGIFVPSSSVETYKAATNWSVYANKIKPMSEV